MAFAKTTYWGSQSPVLITLSTIPSRIDDIELCLQSLLSQDYPNFGVVLNIPELCERSGEHYFVPSWLEQLQHDTPHFSIRRVDQDLGPITKLVPTLQARCDSLVAVCDDDQIYGPQWLSSLVAQQRRLSHLAVVGFSGMAIDSYGNLMKYVRASRPGPVLFTQGYTGYLFDARHLGNADLLQSATRIWQIDPVARFVDDVIVGAFFDELGMPRFIIPQPQMAYNKPLNLGNTLHEEDLNYAHVHGMTRHRQIVLKLRARGWFRTLGY